MKLKVLVLLLLLLLLPRSHEETLGTVISSISLAWSVGTFIYGLTQPGAGDVLEKMDELFAQIDGVERVADGIGYVLHDVQNLQLALPVAMRYELRMDRLSTLIGRIDTLCSQAKTYIADPDSVKNFTLLDFAETVVSHAEGSVKATLEYIHNMVVPPWDHEKGLFYHISKLLKTDYGRCQVQQSPRMFLLNVHEIITLTHVKGFALIESCYMLLSTLENKTYEKEVNFAQERFTTKIAKQQEVVESLLKEASREYWKCEPTNPAEGDNYIEMKNFLRGYVINEIDMGRFCRGSCDYKYEQHQFDPQKSPFSFKRSSEIVTYQKRCTGPLTDCRKMGERVEMCYSKQPNRVYDWVRYDESNLLGDMDPSCSTKKMESFYNLLYKCEYCFCICNDELGDSDRYFDLRPLLSKMSDHYVITGIQITKSNGVVGLKIETGRSLPNGAIKQDSLNWSTYNNSDVHSLQNMRSLFRLTKESRGLDLSRLMVPKGSVITGVRLVAHKGHLGLQVLKCDVNEITGELIQDSAAWIVEKMPRKQALDRSTVTSSRPHFSSDEYVTFTHSSLEHDAAQSTVPFLDSQPVNPRPAVPLMGVGLYYRGNRKDMGYVGVMILTE